MGDYYQHLLSSMSGTGQKSSGSPLDAAPPTSLHQASPLGMAVAGGASNSFQNLGFFTGFPEPIMFNNAPKPQRNRRKSTPGGVDHVKHRRTRSGCFTCRSRRVKCDETHPICDRCRKGKRECIYPPDSQSGTKSSATSTSKDTTAGASQPPSPTSSHDDDDYLDDNEPATRLGTILDEEEEEAEAAQYPTIRAPIVPRRRSTASTANLQRIVTSVGRQGSETPSLDSGMVHSPSTSTGTASSMTVTAQPMSELTGFEGGGRPEWAHLPHDVRLYLAYFCENITHHHYGMITDPDDFCRAILPALALTNEALLYAIVGFAAYHSTLRKPRGKIQQFLQYYNKSVTILLGFLKRKETHNPATLLTILQLATIEEYFGDWVNLMGHQRAAYEVLTQLYTPHNVAETPTGRAILAWYIRFDAFVGLMGGFPSALPEIWFTTIIAQIQSQAAADPANITWKIDEFSARLRLLSREISVLMGKRSTSEISDESFAREHASISQRLAAWRQSWDPAIADPAYLVRNLGEPPAPDSDNIVDVSRPGVLYEGPLFPTTLLSCEWHTVVMLHEYQAIRNQGHGGEDDEVVTALTDQAYLVCQIVESIERWPPSPKGSFIITQACLAVAALFLPHDARHQKWIRRKFALLESMGYIFPLSMRTRMAELFDDQSCIRWWLADDEWFSPVLQAVRTFADERNATAVSAQSDQVRGVRHIFAKMHVGGAPGVIDTGKGKVNAAP